MEMKKLFPVIHVLSEEQCARNVRTAIDAGADGAFIISHGQVSDDELVLMLPAMQAIGGDAFPIGINLLGRTTEDLLGNPPQAGMIWGDDGLNIMDPDLAKRRRLLREQSNSRMPFYGGVAFKGQRKVSDNHLGEVCRLAMTCMDVVTASGLATGIAADVERIRRMRAYIGDFPLAIASGIDARNVEQFLPLVDRFLVASSISDNRDELVPDKVAELVKIVHRYRA